MTAQSPADRPAPSLAAGGLTAASACQQQPRRAGSCGVSAATRARAAGLLWSVRIWIRAAVYCGRAVRVAMRCGARAGSPLEPLFRMLLCISGSPTSCLPRNRPLVQGGQQACTASPVTQRTAARSHATQQTQAGAQKRSPKCRNQVAVPRLQSRATSARSAPSFMPAPSEVPEPGRL